MANELNGYNLSRAWFDFAYNNRLVVKPVHGALMFYCIELWNKLGQPKHFGLPSYETMHYIGVASHSTFTSSLSALEEFGFISIKQQSKNQHTTNIVEICLPNNYIATKKHHIEQVESNIEGTIQGNLTINNNKIIDNNINIDTKNANNRFIKPTEEQVAAYMINYIEKKKLMPNVSALENEAEQYIAHYEKVGWVVGKAKNAMKSWQGAIVNWFNGKDLSLYSIKNNFNNIKELKSAAVGETYNWAKRVAKNNEEHTAILVDMLAKEGVILIDGKFTHNG